MMKKIALVMDDEIRSFTLTRIAGVLQSIKEANEPVSLYIFRSSGASSMDEEHNIGEYNIYHLPDFSDFDGIIVDLNNVKKDDQLSSGVQAFEYVIEQIKKSGKPRISIANNIEDFYFVGIDNYASMKTMIAHLHEVHNCKSFWFVTGPKGNYENQNRVKALLDYMDAHQLAYSENDFYYENFEYQCGMNGFKKLLSTHETLPDAIICANDNIAIGVCEMAGEMGYSIPQDFKITGFDDYDKAAIYSPGITTVNQMKGETGYQCGQIMLRIWNGEDVPRTNYTKTSNMFRASCGCHSSHDKALSDYIRDEIRKDVINTEYNEQMKILNYELVHCTSITDICCLMSERISIIRDISLYLILDEHLCEQENSTNLQDHFLAEQEQFCTKGYPESMKMVFAYEEGEIKEIEKKEIRNLFPAFESDTAGTDFTFLPLHFGKYTVGYFVVKNGLHLMESRYLINVIDTLSTAIENLYRKNQLKYANDMLSRLYVRDSMTGLFNRLGYQKNALELFRNKKVLKENLTILFIDMDRLKYINDNFGHEYGDFAIKIIANAIFHNCGEEAIPVRWGGDEFLIITPLLTPEELETFKAKMQDEINENAKRMQLPCSLTVSIGSTNTDISTSKSLDDYIQDADSKMYEEKMRKKARPY